VPKEMWWKGRVQRYNMGIVKKSFVSVWHRGRSSQGSGPGGPLTERSPNPSHGWPTHRETYRKQRRGIIKSKKFLNRAFPYL